MTLSDWIKSMYISLSMVKIFHRTVRRVAQGFGNDAENNLTEAILAVAEDYNYRGFIPNEPLLRWLRSMVIKEAK